MEYYIELIIKFLAAIVVAALIGYERAADKKSAGIRTHLIVCITATSLVMASLNYFTLDAAGRIVQGIVTGIGFLGAGAILVEHRHNQQFVTGLTTAASLWGVTILGIMIGLGQYIIAGVATLIIFIALEMRRLDMIVRSR